MECVLSDVIRRMDKGHDKSVILLTYICNVHDLLHPHLHCDESTAGTMERVVLQSNQRERFFRTSEKNLSGPHAQQQTGMLYLPCQASRFWRQIAEASQLHRFSRALGKKYGDWSALLDFFHSH